MNDSSSEPGGAEKRESDGSYVLDVLSIGDVIDYTIPTCSVVTVELQHAVTSEWNSDNMETIQFDVFFKYSSGLDWSVPCSVKVINSCYVPVSLFSTKNALP